MALSREQFDAEVSRLERVASRSPRAYSLRVALLGTLGYAYLLVMLSLLLAVVGGLVLMLIQGRGRAFLLLLKIGLPVLVLVAVVGRALWVRLPPPEGRELLRGPDTAGLWAEVDRVREALGGPEIHSLLLTVDFNASIVQLPRLGLLGPTKNYLCLGLPLMQALPPEQFRAVLAHEFGHLSGAHGRVSAWVYRVRQTWAQVLEALEQHEGWGAAIFTHFFRWYAPFYSAYSFVLARAHEYEADRASARVVGPATTADTLVAVTLRHAQLRGRFWPSLDERARHQPRPISPHAEMTVALKGALEPDQARRWLRRGLLRTTDSTDTHPSLKDRLGALGQTPRAPGPVGRSAAEVLLGPLLPVLAEELDEDWREAAAEQWTQVHEEARRKQQRLAELEAREPGQPLTLAEEWERTSLAVDLRDAEATLPLVRRMLTLAPEHPGAHYTLGRMLLERDEETGLAHLETAMAADPDAILPGCALAVPWLEERERKEEAQRWRQRAEAHALQEAEAREERDSLHATDTFAPHGLSPEALHALAVELHAFARVERAFLVRKVVEHFPNKPLYVIGLEVEGIARSEEGAPNLVQEIAQAITTLEGEYFAVLLNTPAREELGERVRQTAPTPFYERARFSAPEGRDAA